MTKALLDHVSADSMRRQVPVLKPGYTVKVFTKIKEGEKFRIQIFEGLVIRINSGSGVSKTFTVRKMVDGIGVERIFPFFSPNIEKVEVTKVGKVRRAKLYFMRERAGKSARLRDLAIPEANYFGLAPLEEAAPEVVEEVAMDEAPLEETAVVAETPESGEEATA